MSLSAEVVAHEVGHGFEAQESLFSALSFTLVPGEIVGLVGPSGSGKSTLLSLLAGWQTPASGRIDRHNVGTIAWVFQNPFGVARRTALDHVVLPMLARGKTRRGAEADAHELLSQFGLSSVAGHQYRSLSGGEAQRLMLARATAVSPNLLLVDEPTAQLDIGMASTVSAVLRGLAHDNTIVVVATHDPHTREACDRVIDLTEHQTHRKLVQ